jgi:hypothetical protein
MYLVFNLVFRLINMGLLLCAMVGLSRTGFDSTHTCSDPMYQSP